MTCLPWWLAMNGGVVAQDIGMANLQKIDHIVVLMLENRSFDHMLGYLSLEGGRDDIDGLRDEFANDHDGRRYPVRHLETTAIPDDPDHSASSVDLQVGGGAMNGFVASFADTLSRRGVQDGDPGARDGLLQRRRRPGLRSPRPAVRRLRPLVQLGSRRDLAQPPLRDLRPRRPQPR